MWPRIGSAAAIAGWVLSVVRYSIHGYRAIGASANELARWATTTDPTRFAIGIDVEAIGILIVLVFYAWLCDLIRRGGGQSWLPMFAFAMVVVWAAGGIFTTPSGADCSIPECTGPTLNTLASTRDVAQALFDATYVFFRRTDDHDRGGSTAGQDSSPVAQLAGTHFRRRTCDSSHRQHCGPADHPVGACTGQRVSGSPTSPGLILSRSAASPAVCPRPPNRFACGARAEASCSSDRCARYRYRSAHHTLDIRTAAPAPCRRPGDG